ncbi:HK97 gp10 family phage protein [uncultured Vagococcus sp.]|uniref:HK97 gp10 family phage protein n=1 Tax=uncultured Vagococcus sp. TaxID=189676 RepID=UPI00258E4C3F|nr:HK97 gp10 family phage protein [uncultured Vagococcus sp.]
MSKTVKIKGLNAYIRNVNKQPALVQKAVDQEINRSALRVERNAKKLAAWDTGWLSNNIYSTMVSLAKAEVMSPADYSIYIEEGTRYMAAQPFLFPALKADYEVLMRNLNKIMRG